MNKATFTRLVKNSHHISDADMLALEQVVQAFPYCHIAHMLLAKASSDHGSMLASQRLRKAAIHAPSRALLKTLIESQPPALPALATPAEKAHPAPVAAQLTQAPASTEELDDLLENDRPQQAPEIAEPGRAPHQPEVVMPEQPSALLTPEPELVCSPPEEAALPAAETLEETTLPKPAEAPAQAAEDELPQAETEEAQHEEAAREEPVLAPEDPEVRIPEELEPLTDAPWEEEYTVTVPAEDTIPADPDVVIPDEAEGISEPDEKPHPEPGPGPWLAVDFPLPAPKPAEAEYENPLVASIFRSSELGYAMSSSRLGECLERKSGLTREVPFHFHPELLVEYQMRNEADVPEPERAAGPDTAPEPEQQQAVVEQQALINEFLKQAAKTRPRGQGLPKSEEQEDLSARSSKLGKSLISENLAQIFVMQGKTRKAIKIYQQLALKMPEKSDYFASQIDKLQNPSS